MGADITDKKILDLVETTLTNQVKNKITDMSQDLHDFIVVPYFLTIKGGLMVKRGGVGIEETLMVDDGGFSRFVGEYDEDVVNVVDLLKKMRVDWTLLTDNVAYTRSEMLANRGPERINNVIKPRERAMRLRVCKTMEYNFFSIPDASDDLTPWGLKYWIVKNATQGFNGGYPAGFTRIGNINLTEVPQFKNWTDNYTDTSKNDLITKMRLAHRKTYFRSPKKGKGFIGDSQLDRRILLVNNDTVQAVETIGEGQNENLGRDLAPYQASMGLTKNGVGDIMFRKIPFQWAELLDDDSTDPVYGLDMSSFRALTQKGDNMRRTPFSIAPNQHRTYIAHIDHKHQTISTNRRLNYVISK